VSVAPDLIAANPEYVDVVRALVERTPAMRFYGLRLARVAPGEVDLELDFRDDFVAVPGTFQGTIQGAIADFAGTLAAASLVPAGAAVSTIDYTLKFMDQATGSLLRGRGRVLRPGKTLTFCQADVFVVRDGNEMVCATALMTTRNFVPKAKR
jgi:uncharacterized protein (TIGR00369 family)